MGDIYTYQVGAFNTFGAVIYQINYYLLLVFIILLMILIFVDIKRDNIKNTAKFSLILVLFHIVSLVIEDLALGFGLDIWYVLYTETAVLYYIILLISIYIIKKDSTKSETPTIENNGY